MTNPLQFATKTKIRSVLHLMEEADECAMLLNGIAGKYASSGKKVPKKEYRQPIVFEIGVRGSPDYVPMTDIDMDKNPILKGEIYDAVERKLHGLLVDLANLGIDYTPLSDQKKKPVPRKKKKIT